MLHASICFLQSAAGGRSDSSGAAVTNNDICSIHNHRNLP
jgi:hypothetical protein